MQGKLKRDYRIVRALAVAESEHGGIIARPRNDDERTRHLAMFAGFYLIGQEAQARNSVA